MPLHLHENRQETQARVPHYDFFFASLDNFRIHQRPWVLARQAQENHAPIRANLRRGDAPPIPRRLSPIRQRVCEILHQRPNLRCGRVFHLLCCLAQSRISQLQHCSNRHVLPPLRASAFGACLNPVAAPPFYLNSSSLSLTPCLLRQISSGFSHFPPLPCPPPPSPQSRPLLFILIFLRFLCRRFFCVKSPPFFPPPPIPPHGTRPQSPPYSQSHLPVAPEPRPPHESPARTRPL